MKRRTFVQLSAGTLILPALPKLEAKPPGRKVLRLEEESFTAWINNLIVTTDDGFKRVYTTTGQRDWFQWLSPTNITRAWYRRIDDKEITVVYTGRSFDDNTHRFRVTTPPYDLPLKISWDEPNGGLITATHKGLCIVRWRPLMVPNTNIHWKWRVDNGP
ncbi:MAG: hypothetical protein ACXABY_04200 [Candidatus Thorarchaeota archaeon]